MLEQIKYGGWSRNYRMSNGLIDLVITGEVGPRIIRFGFVDEANMFCEVDAMLGKTGGDTFRIYGGHRFWHAPEHPVRTYFPDNVPPEVIEHDGFVRVIQPVEPTTGIQKELDITMADDSAQVRVVHRLRNHNLWSVELAPWGISVMATGGTAVMPHPPRGTHPEGLLPSSLLVLWPYTDMSDPRWTWGERYVLLRQDTSRSQPQKLGLSIEDGWAAYVNKGFMFLKQFDRIEGAVYPDMGCNMETFTNDWMLELEALGPMVSLAPGATVEYTERWSLHHDVQAPANDVEVDQFVLPHITDGDKA